MKGSDMPVTKINLADKLSLFDELWSPRIVGEVNDFAVKIAKLEGEFIWHHHEEEDELFMVLAGRLVIRLRDGEVTLEPGEMVIIPHGFEHLPVADSETHILMFERTGTLNTGNVEDEHTKRDLEVL
jgi:mannose-6-phosphate isomerase-like protein (cupin superfamily)